MIKNVLELNIVYQRAMRRRWKGAKCQKRDLGKNHTVLAVSHSHPRALALASPLPTSELGGWFKFAVTGASIRND